jgi:type VI secretion system protein VasD
MYLIRRIFLVPLLFLLISALGGCAAITQAVLPEHHVNVMIQTDKLLNPDETGRPSPLVVYFYQLRDIEIFNEADFFNLYDKGKQTLGAEYVTVSKVSMTPATSARLTLHILPGVKYIGMVAAYNNMQGIKWRDVLKLDSTWGREKLRVRFTRRGIMPYSIIDTGTNLNKPTAPKFDMDLMPKDEQGPNMRYEILSRDK